MVTQLTCTVGTGSDHCSGLFGPGGSSSSATSTWEVKDSAGVLYDVALGFNVDVLPEPSTIVMVSVGVLDWSSPGDASRATTRHRTLHQRGSGALALPP